MNRASRLLCCLLLSLGLLSAALPARAAAASFDLAGPGLRVAVTRGGLTLPIQWVPDLAEGDRISIKLDLPPDQTERYRIIAAFLRGATDRPPESWFHDAKTWKSSGNDLSLVVPAGARQIAVFVMPEQGGDVDAVVDAVRRQPGTFVRAVQELSRASLDRARLDTFLRDMRQIEREDPDRIADASQALTRSLSIKLKAECLQQPAELQAACLTGDREALLMADVHSSSLASTLVGAPTDLAFQLSATPQGGYGYYSPYIGVVRDLFRIFGAFQSTRLQFIPALSQLRNDRLTLLLNAPLSFDEPTSVMVAALPAIEPPKPPMLRPSQPDRTLCAAPGLVLPVEGAPLIYATRYARDMVLRLTRSDGQVVDVPVRADAEQGGFVVQEALPSEMLGAQVEGQIRGFWGFSPFEGPRFVLSSPAAGTWQAAADASAVVGRDNRLILRGGPAACVAGATMRIGQGPPQAVKWEPVAGDAIALTLPLKGVAAGPMTLQIRQAGGSDPQAVTIQALREVGRIDGLKLHAGDGEALLTGTRLDQVGNVTLGPATFRPGTLSRADERDRLTLVAVDPKQAASLTAGDRLTAEVALTGGRRTRIPVTIASARPVVERVRVSAQAPSQGSAPELTLQSDGIFPQDARLTFAFRRADGGALSGTEAIEVATADGRSSARIEAGKGYDLQDARTGIVPLLPAQTLGPLAYGPLRFRLVQGATTSDWVPLATIVRMPQLRSVDCTADEHCTIAGDRLFLIDAIAAEGDFADATRLPDGFTAAAVRVPPATDGRFFLRLRDDPQAVAVLTTQ